MNVAPAHSRIWGGLFELKDKFTQNSDMSYWAPHADGKFCGQHFGRLHCKTALKHCPKQLKSIGTFLKCIKTIKIKLTEKKKKNIKWLHTAKQVLFKSTEAP